MKKAIITLDDKKKIEQIKKISNKRLVVLPKSSLYLIDGIECEIILTDDLKKSVQFLHFQAKINENTTIIVLGCLRYNTWNNSVYNKIYRLCSNSVNTVIIDDFPFIFDRKNIFVITKMLGKEIYHPVQFYDDKFYIEKNGKQIQANSLNSIYEKLKDYIYCDTNPIFYQVHEWKETEIEKEEYEKYKYRKIMKEKVSKMKAVTGCTGRANRMESKQSRLRSLLTNLNTCPVIIYNWAKGIKDCQTRFGNGAQPISYHQESRANSDDVIFLETIISQKIKFYKKLKQYHKSTIHFFLNKSIGADRMVNNEVIESVNDLNQFYGKTWKSL